MRRILTNSGKPLIRPERRMGLAARVTESVTRRYLYSLEDRAAMREYQLYQSTWADIRRYALDRAYEQNVRKLAGVDGIVWRRQLLAYAEPRLRQLAGRIAFEAYQYATRAYALGYYGRMWGLDMATKAHVRIRVSRLQPRQAAQAALQPRLTEDVTPDLETYAQMGDEWRELYTSVIDEAIVKTRRATTTAVANEQTPNQSLKTLEDVIGIDGDGGAWYRSQLATRTAVMESSNQASAEAYRENVDIIAGMVWLSQNDSRVCPACQRLDGRVWLVKPAMAIAALGLPPSGSHAGCRCTVVPIILPYLEREPNEPPEKTLREWLIEQGLDYELSDILEDLELESSQV